jgi:membrane protein YqaA with SNARE-associated domain
MYERILEFLIEAGYIGIILTGLSEALFMPFPMEIVYLPIVLAATNRAVIYTLISSSLNTK